ncbi:YoaK family protein [Microvirga yunnanensis]|uniref:YoaK family protein n=1 Tax=Microvirga yunnanensis TaxID=2953740 RepID=UPI0021C6AD29|nr:YoaK family protein [Microvirga sp. HBU65207]
MPEPNISTPEPVKGASDHRTKAVPRGSVQPLIGPHVQVGVGVVLIAIAGYVDAIGYIELGGLFASFMSGASISLGVGISEGHWDAVYKGAVLIAVFLAGTTTATILADVTGIWALPAVLLLEGSCLAGTAVLAGTGWGAAVAILPVVAAMGVQNTVLRPVDGVRLGVTFMTGTLVSLGQGLGKSLLGRGGLRGWSPHALLWCAFSAGAAAGASLYVAFGFMAVSGAAALVAAIAGLLAAMVLPRRRNFPSGEADKST